MDEKFSSIVILSTGRTGTKFLAESLQKLMPDAAVFHEAGERSRLINIFGNAYLSGFVPKSFPIWAWNKAVVKELRQAQKKKSHYIDSNNHVYVPVVSWPEIYPNLKILHVVRDPRTYARSHLKWSRQRVKSFIANYLTPFWQPNGFILGEISFTSWFRMSKLERFAWIWDYKNRLISAMEFSPIPYLRVRFEDLFHSDDQVEVFGKILEYVDCSEIIAPAGLLEKKVNTSRKSNIPDWMSWSDDLCISFDQICGDSMKFYGYGWEKEWLERIERSL